MHPGDHARIGSVKVGKTRISLPGFTLPSIASIFVKMPPFRLEPTLTVRRSPAISIARTFSRSSSPISRSLILMVPCTGTRRSSAEARTSFAIYRQRLRLPKRLAKKEPSPRANKRLAIRQISGHRSTISHTTLMCCYAMTLATSGQTLSASAQ